MAPIRKFTSNQGMIMNTKQKILTAVSAFTICTAINGYAATAESTTKASVAEIFTKRFSGRSFDGSRPVTHDQILSILEAGRLAPSSYNEQPWVFIVCDKTTDPQAYNKAFATLVEFNQGWAKNAPLLIVAVANMKSSHGGKTNTYAPYDTGAAAVCMALEASSLGLMAHQMGGFDAEKIRQAFAIPADFVPQSVIAIGYPAADEKQAERERKPLKDNFFMGSWGKGVE